ASTSRPARLALLEERGDSLLSVLRREARDEGLHLALVVPEVPRVVEERLDLADRVRRLFRERLDVAHDSLVEIVDDELDEPPRLGRACGDALARHDQPASPARADLARRALGAAAAGQQTEVDLGEPELSVDVRDPEIAGERDLEPTTEA